MTPLIPTDWVKECGITDEEQIIPKSASQGSELLISIYLVAAVDILSSLSPPHSCCSWCSLLNLSDCTDSCLNCPRIGLF